MSAVLTATIGRVAGERTFLLRIPDDVKKALEARAEAEQRSVNAQILYVVLKDLRESGYWPRGTEGQPPA